MDRASYTAAKAKASDLAIYLLEDEALRWALYTDGTPPLLTVVVDGMQFPLTVIALHEYDPPEIPY